MTSSSEKQTPSQQGSTRRQFLRRASVLGLATVSGLSAGIGKSGMAYAAQSTELDFNASRRIHLINAHTGDDLNVVYYTHGIYIDENIAQLNHLMRDRRANISTSMDTHLYDQVLRLQLALRTDRPVHVLSGYRTPETNAKLRRRSPGVAKYSLHMEGRAADVYIPGISVDKVQKAALSLQAGGVGLYSKSNFVHLDTGPIRHWGS